MKRKKILFGVLALMLTLNVAGCDTKEENSNSNIDSNITSNEVSNKQEKEESNEESTSNINKNYTTMEVTSMEDGSKTKYEVDNYAQGYGTAGLSTQYYFVKDNELYFVSAAEPENAKKVANDVKYVMWQDDIGFIAITSQGVEIPSEYSTYLTALYTNEAKTVKVKSMNDESSSDYVVDNYAQGYGASGMSNNYYYVKGYELYYVNAAEPNKNIKIATGVRYITYSDSDKINGFVAFTTKDFKYVDEKSAYMLKTINME